MCQQLGELNAGQPSQSGPGSPPFPGCASLEVAGERMGTGVHQMETAANRW